MADGFKGKGAEPLLMRVLTAQMRAENDVKRLISSHKPVGLRVLKVLRGLRRVERG